MTRRRTTLVLGALVATFSTGLPLAATAAHADAPVITDGAVFASDTNGDGSYGLYRQLDGGTAQAVVPEDEDGVNDVEELAASQDGGRFAYDLETFGDTSQTSQLAVRDASGRLLRTFATTTSSASSIPTAFNGSPALSPDGSELIWARITFAKNTVTGVLQRGSLSTGAVTTVPGSAVRFGAVYLTKTTLLVGENGSPVTIPVAGGTSKPVTGLGTSDDEFAVSPSGDQLAWRHDTSADGAAAETADIEVASLSVANDGTATIGTPTVVATGQDNSSPTWTHDGAAIRFIRYDGDSGAGDVWKVASTGGTATEVTTPGDDVAVANVVVDDTAPAAAVATPFTLAGASAVLHWTLPADADLSGVSIKRTGGAASKTFFVPAPATSITDTGLAIGSTYSYAITAVDHSGNAAAASTRSLTAVAPFGRFSDPVSTTSTKTAFPVALPAVGTYTVLYKLNNAGATKTWISHGAGASHSFALAPAGSSVALNVQSFDAYGNASAPTSAGPATVPFDQTKATFVGKHLTVRAADKYLGTTTQLQAAGAKAQIAVVGNRFQVIGEQCTTCGVMDVYVDGTRVAGIDTDATARHARVVLYTRALAAGSHTLVVKARGTAGRPNVVLDGFGIRH